MQRSFELHFAGCPTVELVETCFSDSVAGVHSRSIRGKTAGVFRCAGSFQWTSAVRALALLAVKAGMAQRVGVAALDHHLAGSKGSLAASLDYAISKQPEWLIEMFGVDVNGVSLVRRLLRRTNPERKRPGPVVVCFSHVALETTGFRFTLDGVAVESIVDLEHLYRNLAGEKSPSPHTEQVEVSLDLAA